MKNQILKAAKGLRTFTIEDLELVTGFEESEILEVIQENNLKFNNGVYSFQDFKEQKNKKKTVKKVGKTILFKTFADKYIKKLTCKESTKQSYEIYLRLHLLPIFAQKRIIDIDKNDIETFKKLKLKEGLSNKSINNFITLLYGIFECALNEDLFLKNPCQKIEKLKTESKKQNISQVQLNNLLNLAKEKDFSFYLMLKTAVETGLSRGQVLSLKWCDIDGSKVLDKTISLDLMCELNKWHKICPIYSKNLIFPNKNGNEIHADNMIKRKFKPLVKAAGLESLRFLDLKL
ncbi:MAG: hypothetical protein WCK67_11075 [bacterium]